LGSDKILSLTCRQPSSYKFSGIFFFSTKDQNQGLMHVRQNTQPLSYILSPVSLFIRTPFLLHQHTCDFI
jgi:hypothetical protein